MSTYVADIADDDNPYYPSRSTFRACCDYIFALLFLLPIASACVLVGLPLIPFANCAWRMRRRRKPHTAPSSVRVAIIGGGWSGLQLAGRFQELGVSWCGFEASDDFGGSWHPSRQYSGLALHTAAWLASFAGFPFSADAAQCERRQSGSAMHAYLLRFAERYGLRRGFAFNSRVLRVSAQSKSRTAFLSVATMTAMGTTTVSEHGPFDLVLYASIASEPNLPTLPNARAFHAASGEQLHSAACSDEALQRLIATPGRIAVVGSSKSAADVLLALLAAGIDRARLVWVYRRPTVFFKYERFFHRARHGRQSWRSLLRAIGAYVAFCSAWAVPYLALRLCGALDYLWTHGNAKDGGRSCAPLKQACCDVLCCCCCGSCALVTGCAPEPEDWQTMRYGMLDATQRRQLDSIGALRATPVTLLGGASPGLEVVERDGKRSAVTAQTVVWATGYRTGIDHIEYVLDGKPLDEPPHHGPLFEDFLCPRYPVLAIPGALFTSSGPMAARAAADLACWHLCVRPRLSSRKLGRFDRLSQTVRRRAGSEVDPLMGSRARHILFAPGYWSNVISLQIALIARGVAPWHEILFGLFNILVLNRQRPLELGLLGKLEPDHRHEEGEQSHLLRSHERVPCVSSSWITRTAERV